MKIKLLDTHSNKRRPVKKDKAPSTAQLHDPRPEDVFLVLYLMGINR